ncbi:MAG: Asp-tRNA(Asn)/Glu-tRNA(Gln) amidotransferase subunit GatB [Paracoccaceae bacterium]
MDLGKSQLIKGAKNDFVFVIGLEVHAQVASKSKLFSSASTQFGAEPNSNVSFIDAGMPGMLPVVNSFCIEQAVKTGLGINAEINLVSRFDRKNYFYPDLPQGYQISQLYEPIVGKGKIAIQSEEKLPKEVGIERIHLEQDAGKSIHDMDPTTSFVDLNRTGIALMEIVSKPEINSPFEAVEYIKKLRLIMRYLETCDGNMQEGSLRADVNVSVCEVNTFKIFVETGDFDLLGTRCEIKNMNSLKFIQQAINFEARRQIKLIEAGKSVKQETRLYDPSKNETRPLRSKEDAHDYRYFPCPDLLKMEIKKEWVDKIRNNLPELPDQKQSRFVDDFNITPYDAEVIIAEQVTAEFFEAIATNTDGKIAANLLINELFGRLNKGNLSFKENPITVKQMRELINLIKSDKISSKGSKEIFDHIWKSGGNPAELVNELGLEQVQDTGLIEKIVDDVVKENPAQVDKVKSNPKLIGWFVGQVMKKSQGKADPKIINQIVNQKLK